MLTEAQTFMYNLYEKHDLDETSVKAMGMNCEHSFFGTATIGERGQIVIPAEARAELGYQPGDKVLIMRHPVHRGLMLFKIDAARSFLDEFGALLDKAESIREEE